MWNHIGSVLLSAGVYLLGYLVGRRDMKREIRLLSEKS